MGVYVSSFGHIPELMGVARALITKHPVGRPLGAPGDSERQMAVVRAALAMLAEPAMVAEFPADYRPWGA